MIACMECLEPDASQEDGPIEILCPECKQARRQERLTEELEDLFDDLGKALFDEATVVELSNIVGCSQAEAKALLTQHEGNLEMAVQSYIASENQHSVGVEERRKTAEERGASRSAPRDAPRGQRESFEHFTGPWIPGTTLQAYERDLGQAQEGQPDSVLPFSVQE